MVIILIALRPIPPKFVGSAVKDKLHREANKEVFHNVLVVLFKNIKTAGITKVQLTC